MSGNLVAYEHGFIHVPKNLEPLRQLLISNPRACLQEIEQPQRKAIKPKDPQGEEILSNQLAALCAYRISHTDQALDFINRAIEQATEKQYQAYLTQAYIIAGLILSGDPKQASASYHYIQLAQQSLDKLNVFPLPNMRFQLEKVLANYYQSQGKSSEAKTHLLKAKEEAYAGKSEVVRSWSENLLAEYYLTNNQPELALSHLSEVQINQRGKPSSEALLLSSIVNANIAKVYLDQVELAIAEQYQQEAIASAVKLNNPDIQAKEIAALGDMAELGGDIDAALVHYLNAKDIAKANHNKPLLADIELRLGKTYMELSNYTPALVHLQIARQLFSELKLNNKLLRSLLLLGELHINNHENGLAILQLEKAEKIANTMGLTSSHSKVYKLLTQAYEQNGNYDLALEQFKVYHNLSQQYQQIRNELKREQFKQHYQYIEQAQQLSELTKEKALMIQQSNVQQLVLVLVCAFGIMLLFLYLVTRQKLLSKTTSLSQLTKQFTLHPMTGLPQLANSEIPLLCLDEAQYHPQSTRTLALLSIEYLGFSEHQTLGFQTQRNLLTCLISDLKDSLEGDYKLGHINDKQLILCIDQANTSPHQLCQQLTACAKLSATKQEIELSLAIGCCSQPFLVKAKDAIDDKGMTEVLWLALEGAQQLCAKTKQSQWVELSAMSGSHAAFFCSNITEDIKQAIAKGLVKVNASADKTLINW